jgi:Uma2 family endonuclease
MTDFVLEPQTRISLEDFLALADEDDISGKRLQLVSGEIIEVPSNAYASSIAQLIAIFIHLFIRENEIEGHLTGEAGGYMINGEPYAPDVAYLSKAKQRILEGKGYNSIAPDLVVEVEYPSTTKSQRALTRKLSNYAAAGTLVWVVYPEEKSVEVYSPGQAVKVLTAEDEIDGGEVLPGFKLPLKNIFNA